MKQIRKTKDFATPILAAIYQKLMPQLQNASRVANYHLDGYVVIHANNNAVAAKLRQLAPSIEEGFLRSGIDCAGIKIKIELPLFIGEPENGTVKPLSAKSYAHLVQLQARLADSPLKDGIAKLLAQVAKEDADETNEMTTTIEMPELSTNALTPISQKRRVHQ